MGSRRAQAAHAAAAGPSALLREWTWYASGLGLGRLTLSLVTVTSSYVRSYCARQSSSMAHRGLSDAVRRTGTTSVFKASMCLFTLKRLCSGQQTRPSQTSGPIRWGCCKTARAQPLQGPGARRNTWMPTMAIINSAVALNTDLKAERIGKGDRWRGSSRNSMPT
jgi:hypothetical protein